MAYVPDAENISDDAIAIAVNDSRIRICKIINDELALY